MAKLRRPKQRALTAKEVRPLDIRVLRYFLAVAREGTISGAAAALHVTQPTLSRQLMELEEELGARLFIRGKRHISLTEEGLFLRKRAQEIVALLERTEAAFTATGEEISGDVYIGGGETEGMRFIARAIREVRQEYPHIAFHLFSGNAEEVREHLDRGSVDFGLFIEPADLSAYDFIPLPARDTWGVLMRKDHPLAAQETIDADDLAGLPLIMSRQGLVENEFSGWMDGKFRQLSRVATYNLLYNAALLVEEGVGCALCLEGIVRTGDDSPLCFRPLRPRMEVGLKLAWKKQQCFTRAAEIFLNRLKRQGENITL